MQQYISAQGVTSTRGRDELWEDFFSQAGGVGLWYFTPSVGPSVGNRGYSRGYSFQTVDIRYIFSHYALKSSWQDSQGLIFSFALF